MKHGMFFVLLLFFSINTKAFKNNDVPLGLTPAQELEIVKKNNEQKKISVRKNKLLPLQLKNDGARPFVEYEDSGYVILSSDYSFSTKEVKREIAKNLPADVKLVVFTYNGTIAEKNRILQDYSGAIDASRIIVMHIQKSSGNGFWARDGVPVPILTKNNQLRVIDARYYHNFEADAEFASKFNSEIKSHSFYYEGGNYMPSKNGTCLVINNERVKQIPDDIFTVNYACTKLIRLPHRKGIGHADESVKFIDDKLILTDLPEYKTLLEKEGFEVRMLPRPGGSYETYVNSLLINGTLYLPVFGHSNDNLAISTYQALGFNVVPINTSYLSNNGRGSIHCITMNYPKVPIKEFLSTFGASIL